MAEDTGSKLSDVTDLINVIGAVKGSKSKRTTQTQISDAGVQELLNTILAGPGGVKSIGASARRSGLYNSTTEDNMLADLYSRAATKTELARSPTVETSETPGVGVGSVLGTLAASSAMSSIMKGEMPFAGAASKLSGLFTGGGEAVAAPISASIGQAGVNAMPTVSAELSGTAGGVADLGTALGGTAGGVAVEGAAGSFMGKAGSFLGANAIPLGGAFLGGLLGGKDAAEDPKGLALSAGMGALAMGPIGLIAAPLASLLGGFLHDVGPKIEDAFRGVGDSIADVFGW